MMRTRHAVVLLALAGGIGAGALALATHRHLTQLELAQRLGGEEARAAALATARFGQVQELGFLALAIVFLALVLLLISMQSSAAPERPKPSVAIPPASPLAPPLPPAQLAPIAPQGFVTEAVPAPERAGEPDKNA